MHFPSFGGHTSYISFSFFFYIVQMCIIHEGAMFTTLFSLNSLYDLQPKVLEHQHSKSHLSHSSRQQLPAIANQLLTCIAVENDASKRMNASNVCFFPVLVQMLGTLRKISSCNRKCLEDLTLGTLSSLVKFYEVLAFYFKTMISICYPSTPRHLHALSIMASLRTLSCCWMAPMVEPLVLYRNSCPKCTAWHPMWHLKRSKTWENCLTAPAGVAALRTWDCTQSLGYFYLLLAVSLQLHCN